ncbi:putative baseplate assembly protein [Sedimentitalea sp.]|uniref:putative baseplate assembly protein n=1 Tax=Sedimentitalea sp. TaxID=2048915 RepID=UPI0032973337
MPLPPPEIDTRTWRELMDEALRRNAVHTPEWTNLSDTDPGVTLLQLFAFMSESIIYRTNNVPERNRRAFLRLLGLGLSPPGVSRGLVAFEKSGGPIEAATLGRDTALSAGPANFSLTNGLDVLPVSATVFYKRPLTGDALDEARASYGALYASFTDPPTGDAALNALTFYETVPLEPPRAGEAGQGLDVGADAIDGLWVALFARRADDVDTARGALVGKSLSLGIMPALDETGLSHLPGQASPENFQALVIETPNPGAPGATPSYRPLNAAANANPLVAPALLDVALGDAPLTTWDDLEPLEPGTGAYPPDLTDDPRADQLVTWLRVRLRSDGDALAAGGQVSFKVSWVGINAGMVEHRRSVPAELLRQGTGQPEQTATLANTPVIADSLVLRVNGTPWTGIDDLLAAPAEAGARGNTSGAEPTGAEVFTIDATTGEIAFGDGLHGMRPPRGAVIVASYDHGGGPDGLIGIGAMKPGAGIPEGVRATNPVPTWGGSAGETIARAERRVPSVLANRDRVVTSTDFATIARGTPGVDIGRVDVLPLVRPADPSLSAPGAVTVMVIPNNDPRTPRAPQPDRLFLQAVCKHMAPRRLITSELHVHGPVYVDVWVSISFEVMPGRDTPIVRNAVTAAIKDFLSALDGGFAGNGWPLETAVDPAELLVQAAQVDGVRRIDQLLLGDSSGAITDTRSLTGLELPRLAGISVVASSDPIPLDELQGLAPAIGSSPAATPVPAIPEEC